MKKGWIVATLIITCSILALILFQLSRIQNYDNNHSIRAIPNGAGLIVKADNLDFLEKTIFNAIDFKEELFSSELIKQSLQAIILLDSLNIEDKSIISDVKDYPFYCSFHEQGKASVKCLYMIEMPNRKAESELISLFKQLDPVQYQLEQRKYNSNTIHSIKNKNEQWFFYINNGVALASTSNLLIEASIRQLQSDNNWIETSEFKKIEKTMSSGSKLHLFINYKNLPSVLMPFVNSKQKQLVNKLEQQSMWGELDIDIKDDAIICNGFSNGNNNGIYSHLLAPSKPISSEILEVFPSNTRAYLRLGLESGQKLKSQISAYRKSNGLSDEYQALSQSIESKYGINPDLYSISSGELALVYGDYNHLSPEANGVLVLKLNSKSAGKEATLGMLKMVHNSKSAPTLKTYKPDNEVSYKIYKGFNEDIINFAFGDFLPQTPHKYLAFFEDQIIMANAPHLLEQFIYANMLKKTLQHSKTHQSFLANFSSRDNAFAFCESAHIASVLGSFLEPLIGTITDEQKEALNNFYGFGLQLGGTRKMIYSTIYMQYLPARESEPRTIWQSLLDSTVYTKPVLVKNHYTKEREVIVQDNANNLYLMSNSGRVLWKKPLDSPIMGEVIQIDYYRNNKLQYLFNTQNSIYILDRNGNHVSSFPVRLPSPASNGLAVFDYDNSRNYRMFVACKNKRVYLYDTKGNIVSGWKFGKTDGTVTLPLQHFRSNNKDYIAFADNKRNYICDRQGNIRVKLKTKFIRNEHSPYYLENKNTASNCLVTTNNKGLLMKISLADGSVNEKELLDIDGAHSIDVFPMNGQTHYLISQPNSITCFTKNGNEVFEKEFDNSINLNIDRYQFSSTNIKFGVSEYENGRIHLFNKDGKAYKGFPLKGYSRFSIGFLKSSSSRFNLIVGGSENYIYNYQVD